MRAALGPADFARAVFFALLPAIAAGGAMGLPLLMALAGLTALGPSLFRQVIEKRPLALVLLVLLAVWAGVSSLWSPWHGPTALKIAALLALGLPFFAAAGANENSARLTLAGAIAAFVALCRFGRRGRVWHADQPRDPARCLLEGELNRNPSRGLIVLLALTWPVIGGLLAQRRTWSFTLLPR
ncbi:MAG: hypothetical protein IPL62_20240 [Caulobacteraceae bacterium]|nr:hypothetical protein [Caulobacteraceae bacterium]